MNITKLTEQYIETHLSINDCIKNRLINYSKLSRKIIKALDITPKDFDAVLIACRRYYWKTSKVDILEDEIIDIISKSKIEIKNKIAVAVIDKYIFSQDLIELGKKAKKQDEIFYAIEGSKAITLVVSSEILAEIKKIFKTSVKKSWKDLALVTIKSPEGKQDTTPGFIGFITNKIGHKGINILEIMSCWSETLLVVNEKDIAAVVSALKF